ncbi:MAG: PAS domain S-box protein [bacterium]|nr:PAS domain S-box protein [bacterium]
MESLRGNLSAVDLSPEPEYDPAEQLTSLLNNVPGAAYRGLPDWSIQFFGEEIERMTGYPAGVFLRGEMDWRQVIHPEDLPGLKERFRRAVAAREEVVRVTYRIRRRDGSDRWIEDRRQMIYGADGRLCRVDGLLLDITEGKVVEGDLRKTLALLNATLDSTADGILVVDGAGKIATFNRRFLDMWRIPEEIVASRDDDRAISFVLEQLEFPERFLDKVRELYGSPREASFDLLEFKDGRVFERYSLPMRSEGTILGRVWSFRDVTERKRAEGTVVQARTDWEDTFDNMMDAVTVHDTDFNIIRANRAARDLLKLPLIDGTSPVKCFKYYHGTDEPPESCPSCKCLSTSVPSSCEVFEPHLIMNMELRAIPRFDRDRRVVGLIHVVRDITDRNRREEELRKSNDMLRQSQKMEAVGQLAGGVAHDFNNLLTVIGGYSDLLAQRLPPDSPYRREVEEIRKAGTRAASLTRQLLAFSRKQVIAPRVADLNEVVAGTEQMLHRLIGEDIDLVTVLRPGLWNVRVDTGQIEQVLLNLAVNARDAMPGIGKLLIETENGRIDGGMAARLGFGAPGEYVILSVRDTGSGMDAETLSHIFEPFFTTKETGKGTGLGLATVYGIVKQSDGYITADSRPGEGATFRIFLPRCDARSDSGIAETDHKEIEGGRETVLLVEDDEMVRNYMRAALSSGGYTLLDAADGEEAIALIQASDHRIDLVITDVIMPKMGGKELNDWLAGNHPEVKVLFVSGYVDNELIREQRFGRGEAYLQKPFTPEALLRTVRKALM